MTRVKEEMLRQIRQYLKDPDNFDGALCSWARINWKLMSTMAQLREFRNTYSPFIKPSEIEVQIDDVRQQILESFEACFGFDLQQTIKDQV